MDASNHVWQYLVRISVITDQTCGCKVPPSFFFGNGGEWFCRILNIFAQMFVFAVVGFS